MLEATRENPSLHDVAHVGVCRQVRPVVEREAIGQVAVLGRAEGVSLGIRHLGQSVVALDAANNVACNRPMSADLNSLRNLGAVRLNETPRQGEKTIIILGVARGGTSMVAGVLRQLGVFLGDKAAAPVFEDVRLAEAIEAKDPAASQAIASAYDSEHPVWAFKRPGLIEHLSWAPAIFRHPIYVVIFRDVLAIANRNALSMRIDALKSMKQSLRQYDAVRDFVSNISAPALLISNEKALIHPMAFVTELVEWAGLEVTPEQLARAAASIVVDPPDYLDASRLQFLGRLDRATVDHVGGWAFIRGRSGPATVEILVSGRVVATVVADRLRPDVKEKGIHPTGACGFRYTFRAEDAVRQGEQASVRFTLGGEELKGGPRVLE